MHGALLGPGKPSESAIRDWCVKYLVQTLGLAEEAVGADVTFARLGLDSANSLYLIVELEEWLGIELTPELVFDHPTVGELARYLAGRCADDIGAG